MKVSKWVLIFSLIIVLGSLFSLSRCGAGLGEGYDANVSGMKF